MPKVMVNHNKVLGLFSTNLFQSTGLCIGKPFEASQIKLLFTFFHKELYEQELYIPS